MTTFEDNKKLKVIQFFGGPSTGKSVAAAELFALMKKKRHSVELIHEFAKDLVWDGNPQMFYEQDWIFANQHRLQRRLVNHNVEYAVTDTSILLGIFYTDSSFPTSMRDLIVDTYHSYTNINILLARNPAIPFEQLGRNQNEQQSIVVDNAIRRFFDGQGIEYVEFQAGDRVAEQVYDKIMQRYPQPHCT